MGAALRFPERATGEKWGGRRRTGWGGEMVRRVNKHRKKGKGKKKKKKKKKRKRKKLLKSILGMTRAT